MPGNRRRVLIVVAVVRILTTAFFFTFFDKTIKFLCKFNLVFSLKGLGFRQQVEGRRLDRRSQQGGSGGQSPPA